MINYTDEVKLISQEFDVPLSVAEDINYLQQQIENIVKVSHSNPELRDFPVFNRQLEMFLSRNDNG